MKACGPDVGYRGYSAVFEQEFCDKWGSGVHDEARPGEEPRQGAQFGKHVQ